MTINRTTLLDLPLPVTGTESGVWGDVVNNGLSQYIDISVAGSLSLSADSDTNLSSTEGDASSTNIGSTTAQYAILRCTGARTATRNINAPAWAISGGTLTNYSKIYIVVNETTGSQNIVLRATNSATPTYTTGVTIVPGERAVCAWNGSDFVKVGGAAGGSTTQVQFNNAGVFGGITNATTDGTTLSMTSPKVITSINDTNGNELFKLTATGSAVNEVTVANAATGNNPVLSATGNDTNIGINLTPKGSGAIKLSGLSYPTADGSPNQAIVTNGSGTLSFATISTAAATPTTLGTVYGNTPSAGTYGTFLGYQAGNVTTGANNVAIGNQAFLINTTGAANTAVGTVALGSNITGSNNVAVGSGSLYINTASNNTGIGTDALRLNTTGASNVALGYQALYTNTTASNNTAVGYQAGYSNTTGINNVVVGTQAGYTNSTGNAITAVGYQALQLNTAGSNTAFGMYALQANTTGVRNHAFGGPDYNISNAALQANTTGSDNVAMGTSALALNTTGGTNVAFGNYALRSNTTANNNTAIGYQALYTDSTASQNTAVGYQAGYTTNYPYLVAVGYKAAYAYNPSTEDGGSVYIGHNAGVASTTGQDNTVVGGAALSLNNTGSRNTVVGSRAAYKTTSSYNVAIGADAIYNNTSGANNVAVGREALISNTTASYNTAVGYQAGYTSNATAAPSNIGANVFIGSGAGYSTTSAIHSVMIGAGAGYNVNTGSSNTLVGRIAGYNLTSGTFNTFVGPGDNNGGSGYLVSTGGKNTIIGAYNGNQDGLDIRTASNYAVISDGDGNRLLSTANSYSLALDGGAVPQSGTGITFPATQSASSDANTLDDYEEGTWTPTLTGASSDPTVTYTTQTGQYTKVGRVVHVQCSIVPATYSGGSGVLRIAGLPFTSGSSTFYVTGSAYLEGVDIGASRTWATSYVAPGVSYIRVITSQNNGAASDVLVGGVSAGDNFIIGITYMV